MVPPNSHFGLPIKVLHYSFPACVLLYYAVATTITICALQTRSLRIRDQHVRRSVIIAMGSGLGGTYLLEAVTLMAFSLVNEPWFVAQDYITYLLACALIYGVQVLAISEAQFPVWYPYSGSWLMGVAFELALLILANVHRAPPTLMHFLLTLIKGFRLSLLLVLPFLYLRLRNDEKQYDKNDAERQSLLQHTSTTNQNSPANHAKYGSTTKATEYASDDSDFEDSYLARLEKAERERQTRLQKHGHWWTYASDFSIFVPYVWPANNKALQCRIVLAGLCLLSSNAFHMLLPWQFGNMIDSVAASKGGESRNVWLSVLVYAAMLFVNSTCIEWLRTWLWLPVSQRSYEALSVRAQAHILSLSCEFHESKDSSDLMTAVNTGRSVCDLLDIICFQALPILIDITAAFVFLWSLAGPMMGFIMMVTMVAYLYLTSKMMTARSSIKRDAVKWSTREWRIGYSSLSGWTTANLFNMIPYETKRYSTAVKESLKARKKVALTSQAIGASQAAVMACGFLGTLILATYQCRYAGKSVGHFSTMIMYWGQLSAPLSSLSSMHLTINYSLIDAERLLELFQTESTIHDAPDAKDLKFNSGTVSFKEVAFSYSQRKDTLKDISFVVPPGKTFALVGQTGGGKSTIFKLLDRFYDVTSGSISIDGQDIRNITLESLRDRIGVVPQEPMMFQDTIMNNVRYARLTASDEEVFEACRAAVLHDKIMTFPKGYKTKVGSRGVKLSGGEKQRVAIARAILKKPDIILLDEATSAVDTETELLIQQGFETLCKNRTTIVIAHRLSTVMRADGIVVMMNGKIVEQGDHTFLLQQKGKYHDLWSKQIFHMPTKTIEQPTTAQAAVTESVLHRDQDLQSIRNTLRTSLSENDEAERPKTSTQPGHRREHSKLKADAPEFIPRRISSKKSSMVELRESLKAKHSHSMHDLRNRSQGIMTPPRQRPRESRKMELSRPSTPKSNLYHGNCSQPVNQAQRSLRYLDGECEQHSRVPHNSPHDARMSVRDSESLNASEEHELHEDQTVSNVQEQVNRLEQTMEEHVEHEQIQDAVRAESSKSSMNAKTLLPKDKRSRLLRRHATKSEPASKLHNSTDGAQDSELNATVAGSEEPSVATLNQQRRRVTAPSDPPSGPQGVRRQRYRRSRHWRLRNKAGDKSGLSNAASGTSGSLSEYLSTDGSVTVPFPSPAAGVPSTDSRTRFAPGP